MSKKTAAVAAAVPAVEKPSKLFRQLSTIFLVSSVEFARQAAKTQTNTLAKAKTPIEFVPDFNQLQNKTRIREALLAGADVSRELEFNGIELTEEDRAAMKAVIPILQKIAGMGPSYPWLPEEHFANFTFSEDRIQRGLNNDHKISRLSAKKIWDAGSLYWSGGKKPSQIRAKSGGYYTDSRYATFRENGVDIGCQSLTRAEVEFVARNYGWDPVVFAG